MDLQYREFPCLAGSGELPHVATACARIKECSGRGYQVEVNYGPGEYEAHVLPTLAAARAVVEQAVAEAKEEVERAAHDVRRRILTHPWWLAPVGVGEVNKIVELTSIHPQGVVQIDPWGVSRGRPKEPGGPASISGSRSHPATIARPAPPLRSGERWNPRSGATAPSRLQSGPTPV